jgi:thiol-disulfide isomerase/thioredoxin
MNRLFCLILLLLPTGSILSQTVNFYFPEFAGSEYFFTVYQGQKNDTIQRGKISGNGRLTVIFPERLNGYKGMCSWTLAGGGGMQFILTQPALEISCTEKIPSSQTIIIKDSKENEIFNHLANEQHILFQKIENYFRAKEEFDKKTNKVEIFNDNFPELQKEYEDYQHKLSKDKSYAAFYLRLHNYLKGIGSKIYTQEDSHSFDREIADYITKDVDMQRLYTSGSWNYLISVTFRLFPDQKDFGDNMVEILKRIDDQRTLELFANDLMMICEQFGWDDSRDIIVDYLESSNRIKNPAGLVKLAFLLNKTKPGSVAPPLNGVGSVANSLLIFYESGCEHCNEQLNSLIKNYDNFKNRGIKIISISTDTSEEVFKYHSAKYPWADKLCDYKGFNGDNFLKYGVFGTPTLYYIGKDGKVIDRKAKLEQITALGLQ